MDTIPSWQVPHRFRRLLPPGRGEEVVTYGLVSIAMAEAEAGTLAGARALAEPFGLAPLAKLSLRGVQSETELPYAVVRASPFSPSAAERIIGLSARAEMGLTPNADPEGLLAEWVDEGGTGRIGEWLDEIAPLVVPVGKAADAGERPPADDQLVEIARDRLELDYGRGLALERFEHVRRDTPEPLSGFRFRSLQERAAVELYELYTIRPVLQRCELCHRVFAPADSKPYCRFNLWRIPSRDERAQSRAWRKCVAFCVPDLEVEKLNKRVRKQLHTNRRKALAQTWRRRRNAYGDDDERTIEARGEYDRYMEVNRGRPGPPTPDPDPELRGELLPSPRHRTVNRREQ